MIQKPLASPFLPGIVIDTFIESFRNKIKFLDEIAVDLCSRVILLAVIL